MNCNIDWHEYDPLAISSMLSGRRVMLFGEPGIGKSTFAEKLARSCFSQDVSIFCISGDPGSPAFGVPGTVGLARWQGKTWELNALEPLCSLDAARFRLPLITAISRLFKQIELGDLLLDMPGVVHGAAGAELLEALVDAAKIDLILVLEKQNRQPPLLSELSALSIETCFIKANKSAVHPGKKFRKDMRTRRWNEWLKDAEELTINWQSSQLLGTPPPRTICSAWVGRQIAIINANETQYVGEIVDTDAENLKVKLVKTITGKVSLSECSILVRDAGRNSESLLVTRSPQESQQLTYPNVHSGAQFAHRYNKGGLGPTIRLPSVEFTLLNGATGDPLVWIQMLNRPRCLLFDLGDVALLRSRILHRVTDIFISHTHMDHIFGFPLFLRSRMGGSPLCRFYGPQGLADNILGSLHGYHWDRIGDDGPQFDIGEISGNKVQWFRLQAGYADKKWLREQSLDDGLLLAETDFCVRCLELDHGIPVFSYRFEGRSEVHIISDRIKKAGLMSGPWLAELRRGVVLQKWDALIKLPTGELKSVKQLEKLFVHRGSSQHVVYATDLADTQENRSKLIKFASGAHTLICEAPFMVKDQQQAKDTQHLTTKACAEIATMAKVEQLLPFHFSSRYEQSYKAIYEELFTFFPKLIL